MFLGIRDKNALGKNGLKDVSALLDIISSVRKCNIEIHLEVARILLSQFLAFGYSNYSRYLTYQNALLEVHCIWNTSVWKYLKGNGFGGD